MQFFRDTHFDFMRYRRFWFIVSMVVLVASFVYVATGNRLNLGIDFSGGTQLTVKFAEAPDVDVIRELMVAGGFDDASIQRFGDTGDNAVIIKTPLTEDLDEGSRAQVESVLSGHFKDASGKLDVNLQGVQSLADELFALDPDQLRALDETQAAQHYQGIAAAVGDVKRDVGLLTSWDQVSSLAVVTPEVAAALEGSAVMGPFTVLGGGHVGPQIGEELRSQGLWAVVLALVGMLAYIWMRFELRYGVGAVVAVGHDVFITLALFTVAGLEFNLTTIAAFLTLVGYSVNDSVVVFDRVRENLRQNRKGSLLEVMNQSLNQTLARTVMTSGTTLVVVGAILLRGGDVLRGFAFILTIGVVVGTYSSIYIASPFALLWERWFGAEARSRRRTA